MDDPVFKQKYQKYKLRVKLWEKDFKRKHGRVPSKYDIREASQEIRDSYKMYYKLKTSFLEDTLNDVLADDGFDILEMSQAEGEITQNLDVSLTESINGGPQLPLDISALVEAAKENHSENALAFSNLSELPSATALTNLVNRDENDVIKHFEAVEELEINKKAWGASVSKQPEEAAKKSDLKARKSLKPNFNEKLFRNSSFSKRNPRKSFSRSTLDQSLKQSSLNDSTASQSEVLPDLETILLQKAKEQQVAAAIAANPLLVEQKKENNRLRAQVDEGWLDRISAQNGMQTKKKIINNVIKNETNNNSQVSASPARKSTYGLSNIDVSKLQLTLAIENTVSLVETQAALATEQNADIVDTNASEEDNSQAAPDIVNANANRKVNTKKQYAKSSDSDSVVGDSEDENEQQEHRHIVKRRRIMPSISPNKPEPISKAVETIAQKEKPDVDNEKDFSVTDEDDKDYEEEKPKSKRKKAVAKRKTTKAENSKKPTATKAAKSKDKKVKQPARTARGTKNKLKKTDEPEPDPNEEEGQPLNPEDLKYALALESGDITCVPRIKASDLDKADDVAQRYINTVDALPKAVAAGIPGAVINEKRAEARRKLEEKIASGKLNENFVTINIEKKKYSRGKKTINFSKYKKKLWKDKKRVAALTGPDMDMRGCDGGVLKCFTCGQVGHFAQNCTVKGDSLLPLTAALEEDPSPFPTLEEAQNMASQSALAAHSRNISKLPQASNAAIYESKAFQTEDNNEPNDSENEPNDESDQKSNQDSDEIHMETDDELDNFDLDAATSNTANKSLSPIKKYVGHKIPAEFLKAAGLDNESGSAKFGGVGPFYDLNADGSVKEVTPEVLEALRMFGHTDFRKGQDRAVMRILSGMSTLVTLSTGSGKSLCYQLPAYLYSKHKKSITLVISPLVSLMEDQVTGVPHFLRAHCLHTNQTPQQKLKTMQLIANGEIDFLLVSPEAVVAGERSTGFGSLLRQLPPIAFACIDEAHCVSQWSHNFRPSYLMICKVLKKNLGVNCVLGLTATATLPTRLSIINHLGILDGERGIISDIPLPDNLVLSVSKDENRDHALLHLLQSKRFEPCQSIIIYCTRRDECERVAGFLRTCMQDRKVPEPENAKKKRKRVNWHAEPYHAGMPASRRRTIQNAFMKNELRIVVATIAFGMGINKPDIRAVIHYNMPRNFESYVQEVGRAGRDNKIAHCHLFLDANRGDQNELRRHIYANSIDRHVIRKLLQRIFVPCSCDKNLKDGVLMSTNENAVSKILETDASDFGNIHTDVASRQHICPGHEIGFSIEQTVEALDIPAENISTLLCYMELDNRWCINVLSTAYIKAKVISYGGAKYLKHAAKECPPLAMAIAMEIKNGSFKDNANIIEFYVVDVAAAIGWNSGVVKHQLKNLEWVQVNGYSKRSPITVSFSELGFRIKAPGDFTTEEIDSALDTLYKRSLKQESTQLIQLQYVFQGLSSVAYDKCNQCAVENFPHDRSNQLKAIIRDYFQNDYPKDLKLEIEHCDVDDAEIESDVIQLINMYPENTFSGRNVARLFHGISSPNYTAIIWSRCKFWRAHSKVDFNRILRLANNVIVKRRCS